MDDTTKTLIVERISEIISILAPNAVFRSMYGGTVFELNEGDPKSRVGGIYTYTHHVSLELTKGAMINDPKLVLEGAGKLRRHVKLHVLEDINNKGCKKHFREAILLI